MRSQNMPVRVDFYKLCIESNFLGPITMSSSELRVASGSKIKQNFDRSVIPPLSTKKCHSPTSSSAARPPGEVNESAGPSSPRSPPMPEAPWEAPSIRAGSLLCVRLGPHDHNSLPPYDTSLAAYRQPHPDTVRQGSEGLIIPRPQVQILQGPPSASPPERTV